ncbi:hypothetical protein A1O1_03423 [Capronia coronata CBS 617.96]|uniref:Uncharacterized protein n=1 Tax=Capronia coronata CBS 617.96 TaxID=1182541 RepID=W9Z731_9EURO|nr:uncharacterized protein A1O1_03423 [Capronia coronata CBS 617.96]EXJ90324.1 hypothetical protein A1O1_03423 [Capronia coronata CBS 617.96]
MPLFGHKNNDPVQPTPNARTSHGARHSTSSSDASSPRHGFFGGSSGRRSSSSDLRDSRRTSTSKRTAGGLFNKNTEDPSISDARQRVASAERAEQEADRALVQARAAVRDARDHVKMIEREAAEEARLAKIKQQNAKDISKRAKPLGRK